MAGLQSEPGRSSASEFIFNGAQGCTVGPILVCSQFIHVTLVATVLEPHLTLKCLQFKPV